MRCTDLHTKKREVKMLNFKGLPFIKDPKGNDSVRFCGDMDY